MLSRVIRLLPLKPELRQVWLDRLIPRSFGQLGEDAVIDNHLGWLGLKVNKAGIYLDIGAHHPTCGSNTYRFYRRGARGIAVDIGLRKQQLWQKVRPRDTFINAAVVPNSWEGTTATFRLSGDYGSATDCVAGYGVLTSKTADIHTVKAPALRAGDLVRRVVSCEEWYRAPWRVLNLDIEGLDEQVLHDLDLQTLQPDVVSAECFLPAHKSNWHKVSWYAQGSTVVTSMTEWGYSQQSICGPSLVFVRIDSKQQP